MVPTGPVPQDAAANLVAALRAQAKTAPDAALAKVAGQFEALFVQMLLKSMREATPSFDPLTGSATKTYQGMLDEQWSKVIAEKGIGLAPQLRGDIVEGHHLDAAAAEGLQELPQPVGELVAEAPGAVHAPFTRRVT